MKCCTVEMLLKSRWAIIVCFAAFMPFFFLGGMYSASGILFSELLKQPCTDYSSDNSSGSNSSLSTQWTNSTMYPPPKTSGCSLNDECIACSANSSRARNTSELDCGGFGESRGSTAIISSTYLALGSIFGVLGGVLIDRFGCRPIAFAGAASSALGCLISSFTPSVATFVPPYGVLCGIGFGLLYTSSIVIVSRHWEKHQALANGIVMSGMGVGTTSFGSLAYAVIKRFQWRGYLRFLTFCFTGSAILTLLYKEPERRDQQRKKLINWSLWKNPAFAVFQVSIVIMFLAFSVPFVHMVRYALDLCVCKSDADFLITYLGVGSISGRLLIGLVGNHKRVHPLALFEFCVGSCGIAILLIPSAFSSHSGLIVFMLIYGFFAGGVVSFLVVVIAKVVGKEQLPQALGWTLLVEGPPNAVAAPIAGWLFDSTCLYSSSFYFGGGSFLVAFVVFCLIPFVQRRNSQENEDEVLSSTECRTVTSNSKSLAITACKELRETTV